MYTGVFKRKVTVMKKSYTAKVVTEESNRRKVFEEYHTSAIDGYSGQTKTIQKIMERFYWPGMSNKIREWVINLV